MMPLVLANIGEENLIYRVGGSPEVKKHLADIGFVPGGKVSVVSSIGDSIIVKVKEARVMLFVYYVSMVSVGAAATDWANDGLFGDGFHLLGIGGAQYAEASEEYADAMNAISAFVDIDTEAEDFDEAALLRR